MSDPTNGWTVDTLHEHIVKLLDVKEERDAERFKSQKEATSMALASADRAVTKAEMAAEKRFEAVNEFRNTLSDQQRTLMPRQEAELSISQIRHELERIRQRDDRDSGRGSGINQFWIAIIGVISIASMIAGMVALFKK